MTCYEPKYAVYNKMQAKKTGKKQIIFLPHPKTERDKEIRKKLYPELNYKHIYIPCGKCIGCKSDNAKMWSIRAYKELTLHELNCFITLTYDDNSPLCREDPLCIWNLRYKHFQLFMKRLRKKFKGLKFSFLMSGEYGSENGRAHFHCILFGLDFPDKKLQYISKGFNHYSSYILQKLWSTTDDNKNFYPIGFVDLTEVDYDCCSYVSQYVLKKAVDYEDVSTISFSDDTKIPVKTFLQVNEEERVPPFIRMSTKPAIGLEWFKQNQKVVLNEQIYYKKNEDTVLKAKVPRYYEKKFEEFHPEIYEEFTKKRDKKRNKFFKQHPINLDTLKSNREAHIYRVVHKMKDCIKKTLDNIKK